MPEPKQRNGHIGRVVVSRSVRSRINECYVADHRIMSTHQHCVLVSVISVFLFAASAAAEHRVLLQAGDRLAMISPDGATDWKMM